MRAEFTSKKGFSVVAPTSTTSAVFHRMQQRVLLAAVEAVDLVDEQDGAQAPHDETLLRRVDFPAQVGHRAPDGRHLHEGGAASISAMTWASDVLPVPAGPKRMTELNVSCLDGRAQPAALAHGLRPARPPRRACAAACAPPAEPHRDFRSFSIAVNKVSIARNGTTEPAKIIEQMFYQCEMHDKKKRPGGGGRRARRRGDATLAEPLSALKRQSRQVIGGGCLTC